MMPEHRRSAQHTHSAQKACDTTLNYDNMTCIIEPSDVQLAKICVTAHRTRMPDGTL